MPKKIFYQPTPIESINENSVIVRKSSDRAEEILKFCQKYFKNSLNEKTLLDLGCNKGYFTNFFSSYFAKVDGIDILNKNINDAKFFYPNISQNFKTGDINSDLYLYDDYDVLLFLNILHTMIVNQPEKDVKEFLKILDEKTKNILFIEMKEDEELYWIPQEQGGFVADGTPIFDDSFAWNEEKIKNYVFENTSFNQCEEIISTSDFFDTRDFSRSTIPSFYINRKVFAFYRK